MARSQSNSRAHTNAQRVRDRRKPKAPASSNKQEMPSRGLPPVMVRGGGYPQAQSKKSKRRKPAKRRYDIAMATPGVEIRLPSVPDVRLGWRMVSFILTAGLIVLLYFLWTSPTFQVQLAEVQGVVRLTENEINRAMNVYNKPIFSLHPQELEESLRFLFPEMKDVMVQVALPATVVVNVNERVPQFVWRGSDGLKWVDPEGFAFAPRGEDPSLPIVEAYANPSMPAQLTEEEPSLNALVAPTAYLPPELVEAILTLSPQTPENTALVYDPRHGLGWHDARGWDVYFGMEVVSLEEKLLVYDAIVNQLTAEGIVPALINVEHVHAPFYRLSR